MTQHDDLDRMLSAWLDDPYTPPAPRYLGQVLERTRHTRQRPAWASLERWIPMADKVLQPTAAPPMRLAWVLLIALLVVALSPRSRSLAPDSSRSTSIPQGGTAVFAFGSISGQSTAKDILTVRADGTDLRQLTSGPAIKSHPAFSPDGTRIAYRSWENGTDSIVVIDAGGGHPTTLATTPGVAGGLRPGRASRGRRTGRASSSRPIRSATARSTSSSWPPMARRPRRGSSPPGRIAPRPTGPRTGSGSPSSGARLAAASARTWPTWDRVAPCPAGFRLVGSVQVPRACWQDIAVGPQWSPDGTQLRLGRTKRAVSTSCRPTAPDNASSPESRMNAAAEGNPIWSPVWSPNGQQIAYYRSVDPAERFNDRPCTVRTWVIDVGRLRQPPTRTGGRRL